MTSRRARGRISRPSSRGGTVILCIAKSCVLSSGTRFGACKLLGWPKHQLLHPPVQQLTHVELVLRRTRNLVNPAELLGLLAERPQLAQELPGQVQLEDLARVCVRTVENLIWAGSNANRPGLGHAGELAQERPVAVEHLNP